MKNYLGRGSDNIRIGSINQDGTGFRELAKEDSTPIYSMKPDGTGFRQIAGRVRRGFYTGLAAVAIGAAALTGCDSLFGPNELPVAEATRSPGEGYAPLSVNFDGRASYDPDGTIEKYIWDFGDGINAKDSTSGAVAEYTYRMPGEYAPSLTVVDNDGDTGTTTLESITAEAEHQIAFSRWDVITEDNRDEHIYVGDLTRTSEGKYILVNQKRLTNSTQDTQSTWSPDGTEILFTSPREGKFAIWRMNADGSNQRNISSHLVERAMAADWCSNGLIVVNYNIGEGIGIINPDEDTFTSIYSGDRVDLPGWSPDCSEIAYQRYINGNWEVYLMDANGGNQRNFTNNPAHDLLPVWLPDGSGVLFASDRNTTGIYSGEANLYLQNLNGIVTQLTDIPGREIYPSISSDGNSLMFVRLRHIGDATIPYLTPMTSTRDTTTWSQLTTKESIFPTFRPRQ